MQSAVLGDQGVDIRVVEGAHDDVHGVSLDGMEEGPDLPAAEVSGEQHYPLAAAFGGLEILEALVDRDLR